MNTLKWKKKTMKQNETKEQFKRCVDEIKKQKFCEDMYDYMREQIYQKKVKPD